MNLIRIVCLFFGLLLAESVLSAEAITDQQRAVFFDEVVGQTNCDIPFLKKVSLVKVNERCLVQDTDQNSKAKKLIIKLSCRPDEVNFLLIKLAKEYCQNLTPNKAPVVNLPASSTSSGSTAGTTTSIAAPARRPLTRPSGSNNTPTQKRVVYTDAPSTSAPPVQSPAKASSSDTSKASPGNGSGSTAAPAAGSAASSRTVIGGCGTPEQCEVYMAEAAKPKYGWQSPIPFMHAPMNKMNFMTSEDGHKYELPTGACGPSNQGELVAIDYGTETVVAACMGGAETKADDIMAKIKKADISKLPKVVAVKKELYSWQCLVKPLPPPEDGVRACGGPGIPSCEKGTIGTVWVVVGEGCGSFKCVRADGGGLATDKPKPKAKGPCDDK
jgi:hypothetical protein